MHIQLYPKLHPKRFSQAVKDMSQVHDLVQTSGEPLIVEAMTKQVLEKSIHIRRDVTFIGSYVGQFILHDDSEVTHHVRLKTWRRDGVVDVICVHHIARYAPIMINAAC